jgi:hypothetical protein
VTTHFVAAAAAAVTLLAAGCASTQYHAVGSPPSPSPTAASSASTVARGASNPACEAQLSAWRPAGMRYEHVLMHDADVAESDLRSLITQAGEGAQPSGSAALTGSQALASTAQQVARNHLPPSCVPHLRADLTASMLDFEKQAVDVGNASLALADWNLQGAEPLLKAASHDIKAGTYGISRATAEFNSYQG